jgi:hypothetical protein
VRPASEFTALSPPRRAKFCSILVPNCCGFDRFFEPGILGALSFVSRSAARIAGALKIGSCRRRRRRRSFFLIRWLLIRSAGIRSDAIASVFVFLAGWK